MPKKNRKRGGARGPQNWDKVVSAAYLRLLGEPNVDAAKAVGCGERNLRVWQKKPYWKQAVEQARSRWLQGVESGAMRGITEGLSDPQEYATMSRWAAERVIPEMSPPKQRQEHSGPGGGPIQATAEVVIYKIPDNGR